MPASPVPSPGMFSATGVADSAGDKKSREAAERLNKLWRVESYWNLSERVIGLVTSQLPAFTHSISVAVAGGPEADIRRIYYLALSAAFGRYRNKVRGMTQSGQIQATWDITGKACTIEIVYTTGRTEEAASDNPAVGAGVTAGIAAGLATGNPIAGILIGGAVYLGGTALVQLSRTADGGGAADPTKSPQDLFRRGPEQLTIGGNFGDLLDSTRFVNKPPPGLASAWAAFKQCQFTVLTNAIPLTTLRRQGPLREWPIGSDGKASIFPYAIVALPTTAGLVAIGTGSAQAGVNVSTRNGVFNLPDHGRIITTADKTTVTIQPPAPPVDGRTRGGMLALVAQTLQRPCFLPQSPPCTNALVAGGGVWVTNPGDRDDFESIHAKVQAARGTTSATQTNPGVDSKGVKIDGYPAPIADPFNFEHR